MGDCANSMSGKTLAAAAVKTVSGLVENDLPTLPFVWVAKVVFDRSPVGFVLIRVRYDNNDRGVTPKPVVQIASPQMN